MAAKRRKVPEAQFRAIHQKWRQGLLTQREAAARLGLSERTFREYVSGMRSRGSQWWEPRPRPLPPSRRAPDEERQGLQRLYSEHYLGWNVRHFYEKYWVERGRIPQELAARGIGEIGQANQFLTRFWPEFNESLRKPAESPGVFDELSPHEAAGLTDRLCLKHDAQIGNGYRLFCNGREVELPGSRRQELSGSRVYPVHEYEDRSWKVFSRGTTGLDRLKWTELTTE